MSAFDSVTPDLAWGGSTGKGVRIALVDSGVDAEHPSLQNHVRGGVVVQTQGDRTRYGPFDGVDNSGHGTACAGIIARLAPDAEIWSVKVLGADCRGNESAFLAGLRWAIEEDFPLVNLSLGTKNPNSFREFHTLLDSAYFRGTLLVAAASNEGDSTLPSDLAPIISVDYDYFTDSEQIRLSPKRSIFFVGPGVMIDVPVPGGGSTKMTGTSFAAPHVTGLVARILAKHPGIQPFEVKTLLYRIAANEEQQPCDEPC